MQTTCSLVMRPLAALRPNAHNARLHDGAQIESLRRSLREFGFVAPLLIDVDDNIVCGDARLAAAIAEGLSEAPCVLIEHLDETARRAYALADNRLAELATWDMELVSRELQLLQDAGFDLTLTGFDEGDLILPESTDAFEDDAFDPTPPAEAVARRGEIYALGRHRLMCGDATDARDVMALMDGASAHLLLTDPPYNVGITSQTAAALTISNDDFGEDEDAFCAFLQRAFECAVSVLDPGAGFYIWHADGEPSWAFRQACRLAGLRVRQGLVWVKQAATLSRSDYHWQHEPCLHGQVEPDRIPAQGGDGELDHLCCLYGWKNGRAHVWTGDRKQTTVLQFDRPVRSEEHPTMKPVKLFAYLICNSTRPGAVVADFFAGSGTTVIAAEQTSRTAYAMELEPRYVDVIISRWEQHTGQKAVRLHEP